MKQGVCNSCFARHNGNTIKHTGVLMYIFILMTPDKITPLKCVFKGKLITTFDQIEDGAFEWGIVFCIASTKLPALINSPPALTVLGERAHNDSLRVSCVCKCSFTQVFIYITCFIKLQAWIWVSSYVWTAPRTKRKKKMSDMTWKLFQINVDSMMPGSIIIIHYIPRMSDSTEMTIFPVCQFEEFCAFINQTRGIQVIASR